MRHLKWGKNNHHEVNTLDSNPCEMDFAGLLLPGATALLLRHTEF